MQLLELQNDRYWTKKAFGLLNPVIKLFRALIITVDKIVDKEFLLLII
ncbi:39287_t:CDS:2 [Gigaspora margarita]|uniref:39287_t:CDS:1 n=1 Tax=Gigaspora margarita TaxID=4874 RepID=A0ABM8W3R8_GIGMA|nr:39287_t:CDS:2 [Gigaspora margarita]